MGEVRALLQYSEFQRSRRANGTEEERLESARRTQATVLALAQEWGPGARGIVVASANTEAHAFNVVVDRRGHARFIDANVHTALRRSDGTLITRTHTGYAGRDRTETFLEYTRFELYRTDDRVIDVSTKTEPAAVPTSPSAGPAN
jgi:hypothetical protein